MAKNDFKAFATDRKANVISQEEWEALPALLSGFTAGKASSAQVNKVIRQASFIAAALAQFVSDKTQRDVLDNGDLPGFVELLGSGFAVEYLSRKNPFGDIKSDGTVKTALEN
ncbi:phage tail protein, partial [Escherichia coli]|nr:phage tail protein [Escherichia coli]HBN4501815.1 phage tail protein [Escherichia coli O25b:H4-ST131]MCN2600753.1 phage tail protein [Escherichia coli]MCN5923472.1 phage tail protein [Escherichia coli]MCN9470842.1 phage tail protein [Escherichia coli]